MITKDDLKNIEEDDGYASHILNKKQIEFLKKWL